MERLLSHQRTFTEWLNNVLPDTPPANVQAYNFNIAETADAFVVEIIGAPTFDMQISNWACDESWTCRPAQFILPYADIGSDWKEAETTVVGFVREFLLHGSRSKVHILRSSRAIAVGFVDGDLAYVWPEPTLAN